MLRTSRPRFALLNVNVKQKLKRRGQTHLYQKQIRNGGVKSAQEYGAIASEGTARAQRPESVVFRERG